MTILFPPTYDESLAQRAIQALESKHDVAKVEEIVAKAIDQVSEELREISLDLHKNPEIGMEEHHAHKVLTDYLEKKGFQVTRHTYGMKTAFVAEYSQGEGRRIGFCSEYDALPGLGQACGHNLIAIGGVACAIATKALLEQKVASGKVVLFGTPAEERFIGKIVMLKKRAFQDNVDVCLMLHPCAADLQYGQMIAAQDVFVEFRGKASHAGASPWEGVNALDAMVQAWANIGMLRQQLKPTDRVHGIIKDGGSAPNVIPDYTSALLYCRTTKATDIQRLMTKVENCFKAAAAATGCEVTWKWRDLGTTRDVVQNTHMTEVYANYMKKQGVKFLSRERQEALPGGSTDMGNVSYALPCIHPLYSCHTKAANHTVEFTEDAGKPAAHDDTIRASKALSLSGAYVLLDGNFLQGVKQEYELMVPEEYRTGLDPDVFLKPECSCKM